MRYTNVCFVTDLPLPDNSMGRTLLERSDQTLTRDGDTLIVEWEVQANAARGFATKGVRHYNWAVVAYADLPEPAPAKLAKK